MSRRTIAPSSATSSPPRSACRSGWGSGSRPFTDDAAGRFHLAWDGATPVGAAGIYVEGRAGYLTFGSVLPEHRGKGAQRALFAARIREAATLGCELLVTETGAREPGKAAFLYVNILRAGFEELVLATELRAPRSQRLIDVRDQVVDGFQTGRETDQGRRRNRLDAQGARRSQLESTPPKLVDARMRWAASTTRSAASASPLISNDSSGPKPPGICRRATSSVVGSRAG